MASSTESMIASAMSRALASDSEAGDEICLPLFELTAELILIRKAASEESLPESEQQQAILSTPVLLPAATSAVLAAFLEGRCNIDVVAAAGRCLAEAGCNGKTLDVGNGSYAEWGGFLDLLFRCRMRKDALLI